MKIGEACRKAIVSMDARLLTRAAEIDSILVLCALDKAMRGVFAEPLGGSCHLWARDQDIEIRRRMDRRQRMKADCRILRNVYRASMVQLVLGAGVSQGCDLPGWKALVLNLFEGIVCTNTDEYRRDPLLRVTSDLKFHGPSPWPPERVAEVAQFRANLAAKSGYSTQDLLDAGGIAHDFFGDEFLGHAIRDILYKRTIYRSPTFPAIVRMARPPWPKETSRPRLRAILTYNYDCLVETALFEAGIGWECTFGRGGKWVRTRGLYPDAAARPVEVQIVHIHGIVPNLLVSPMGSNIVLTETQYEMMHEGTKGFELASLVRSSHSSFFGQGSTLFIGCSFMDEWVNKLLKDGFSTWETHFNYATMQSEERFGRCLKDVSDEELLVAEDDYRSRGLRMLWIDDFAEIPGILDGISAPPVLP